MTPELLIEMVVQGGYRIKCETVEQRRAVLEFFDERGVPISTTTKSHLRIPAERDTDREYMFPGYNDTFHNISLWRVLNDHTVEYEQIENIIEGPPEILDDRSDAEFAKDFSLLLQ